MDAVVDRRQHFRFVESTLLDGGAGVSIHLTEFDVGDAPRSFGEFRNFDGVLTDPQTVKVSIKPPNSPVVTKIFGTDTEVVKDSDGLFYIDIDANAAGQWAVRWFSEGTGKAAAEMRFHVRRSDFV
jgi:hypothetical protein